MVTPRMAGFSPGTSPPPVRMPIVPLLPLPITLVLAVYAFISLNHRNADPERNSIIHGLPQFRKPVVQVGREFQTSREGEARAWQTSTVQSFLLNNLATTGFLPFFALPCPRASRCPAMAFP